MYLAGAADMIDEDMDQDHLEEIAQLIDEVGDLDDAEWDSDRYHQFRFDLCSECHRKFVKNPLAKEPWRQIRFSDN